MNAARTISTQNLTRTHFVINGVAYELSTFKNGRTEVHVEYADEPGLMQFRGYYDVLCMTDRKLSATVHPFVSGHNQTHSERDIIAAAKWFNQVQDRHAAMLRAAA